MLGFSVERAVTFLPKISASTRTSILFTLAPLVGMCMVAACSAQSDSPDAENYAADTADGSSIVVPESDAASSKDAGSSKDASSSKDAGDAAAPSKECLTEGLPAPKCTNGVISTFTALSGVSFPYLNNPAGVRAVLDRSGAMHVVATASEQRLLYYSNAGGTWKEEVIATPLPAQDNNKSFNGAISSARLAVDECGRPTVAFLRGYRFSGGATSADYLHVATLTNGVWSEEQLYNQESVSSPVIVTAPNGTTYVAEERSFGDPTFIFVRVPGATSFKKETGPVTKYLHDATWSKTLGLVLVSGTSGSPRISFKDANGWKAYTLATTTSSELASTIANDLSPLSGAADANGDVHLAWQTDGAPSQLYYARFSNGAFGTPELVAGAFGGNKDVGIAPRLALSPSGAPFVAHGVRDNGLAWATRNGGTWASTLLPKPDNSALLVSSGPGLVIDASGRSHVISRSSSELVTFRQTCAP